MSLRIEDVLSFGLSIVAFGLVIFSIGAHMGWAWATRSLAPAPPRWIVAVTALAGVAFVLASVLGSNWVTALSSAALFSIIAAGQLRIGPFRRGSGGRGSA